MEFRPIIYGILMWGTCFYAFRRGGWEEKLAIVGIIVAAYGSVLAARPFDIKYQSLELPVALIDLGLLAYLQLIALCSRKFWPLWLAAMHGITLLAHFAPFMPRMPAYIYYNATTLWSYPSLVILIWGIANHHRMSRVADGGHQPQPSI